MVFPAKCNLVNLCAAFVRHEEFVREGMSGFHACVTAVPPIHVCLFISGKVNAARKGGVQVVIPTIVALGAEDIRSRVWFCASTPCRDR